MICCRETSLDGGKLRGAYEEHPGDDAVDNRKITN